MGKHSYSGRQWRDIGATLFLMGLSFSASSAEQKFSTQQILALSLQELSQVKVRSVSKQSQPWSDAPASIYVITQATIRSSGATTIPEALRMAPNLHVARGDTGQYAISARGFNSALGNKFLVLIDGRTVYSPFFGGVFWISQDVLMEDIERIEVISGSGGTMWGSNAVNGVINVVTKSANDTQGVLFTAHAGNMERGLGMRYGGEMGDNGHYRVYAKAMEVDHTERVDGSAVSDAFERMRFGFRADWTQNEGRFTFQGDTYDGISEQPEPGETLVSGTNILARYTRPFDNDSELQVQSYYDLAVRDNQGAYKDEMEIFDLEVQYALPTLMNHRFMFGVGHREARDHTTNYNPFLQFLPENKDLSLSNIFIQDVIALPANLHLTLGAKWEKNVYTGTEFLPNVRLAWNRDPGGLLWAAVSRAVRAPARLDTDFHIPAVGINGGPNFQSEITDAVELGWRSQPSDRFSYSLTAFYNEHDKQRSGEPDPDGPGYLISNTIEGTSKGVEGSAHYQATPRWRLAGGFTELRHDLRNKPGSLDPTGPIALGNDPERTASLRSTYDFTDDHQLFVMARYVSELPHPRAPSYTAVDARYGWRVSDNLELSVNLQNLFDPIHSEFGDPLASSVYERTAYLKIIWTAQ